MSEPFDHNSHHYRLLRVNSMHVDACCIVRHSFHHAGVYDGISARLAIEAGFDTLYMSGASTTASMLGQPDLAIATQNDFVQVR